VSVSPTVWILKIHGHRAGAAIVDSPAVVTLVSVENPELGRAFEGDLSYSQPVLVDPTRRQRGRRWPETAPNIGD
jgi:hypothetical protein